MNINLTQDSAHAAISRQLLLPATTAGQLPALPSDLQITLLAKQESAQVTYKVRGVTQPPFTVSAPAFKNWIDSLFSVHTEISSKVRIESAPNTFTYGELHSLSITGGRVYHFAFSRRDVPVTPLFLTPQLEAHIESVVQATSGLILIKGNPSSDLSSVYLHLLKKLPARAARIYSLETQIHSTTNPAITKIKFVNSLEDHLNAILTLVPDVVGINYTLQRDLTASINCVVPHRLEEFISNGGLVILSIQVPEGVELPTLPIKPLEVFDVSTLKDNATYLTIVGATPDYLSLEKLQAQHYKSEPRPPAPTVAQATSDFKFGTASLPLNNLYSNTLITGAIGSGKTTSGTYAFLEHVLSLNPQDQELKPGGMIISSKGDLTELTLTSLSKSKRDPLEDVILLEPTYNVCYEFKDPSTDNTFFIPTRNVDGSYHISSLIDMYSDKLDTDANRILSGLLANETGIAAKVRSIKVETSEFNPAFLGWKRSGNRLQRITNTHNFSELPQLDIFNNQVEVPYPTHLNYVGLKTFHTHNKFNVWDLLTTPESLTRFLNLTPSSEKNKGTVDEIITLLSSFYTIWKLTCPTVKLNAQTLAEHLIFSSETYNNKLEKILITARKLLRTEPGEKFVEVVSHDVLESFITEAPKVRSSLQQALTTLLMPHLAPELLNTFASSTANSFNLEDIFVNGKIVIITQNPNLPSIQENYIKAIYDQFVKLAVSRETVGRKPNMKRPILNVVDGAPYLLNSKLNTETSHPYAYLALSRQLKLINIIVVQNLTSLLEALNKGSKPHPVKNEILESMIQNCTNFIWYTCKDHLTSRHAKELCGTKYIDSVTFEQDFDKTFENLNTHEVVCFIDKIFHKPHFVQPVKIPKVTVRKEEFSSWYTKAYIENKLHEFGISFQLGPIFPEETGREEKPLSAPEPIQEAAPTLDIPPAKTVEIPGLKELVQSKEAVLLLQLIPEVKAAFKAGVSLSELKAFLETQNIEISIAELLERIKS